MQTLLHTMGIGSMIVGMTIANWLGVVPEDYFVPQVQTKIIHEYEPQLGASVQTGQVKALFETTLASRITSSATSMTLTSATDKDGNTLASSTYAFIIDEGTSVEEFVLADCTSTTCTNLTRGVSVSTGTTTVAALQFEHRRGASVKITDAPALIFATNVLKGTQNIENILHYNTHPTFVRTTDLIDKKYVDDTAFSGAGVIDATASARGVVELATQIETASSTANGSSGVLVIPASNATSTYNSATAALRAVVTQNNGKLDSNFLDLSTYTGSISLATTTTIGSFPAYRIGKNFFVATTTQVFSRPSGITTVDVQCVGAGGGGGTGRNGGSSSGIGGGGGAGAYIRSLVDLTNSSTVTVTVGAGGAGGTTAGSTGSTGGNTTFGLFLTANGGVGGNTTQTSSLSLPLGGAGGAASSTASTTVISVAGGSGFFGLLESASSNVVGLGGQGGSSFFGGGAQGGSAVTSGANIGGDALVWGAGGGGGVGLGDNTSASNGGAGRYGACIVIW